MKKNTNYLKHISHYAKHYGFAFLLSAVPYQYVLASSNYVANINFTIKSENQTLEHIINYVENNSEFVFIYRTDVDL